MNDSGALTAHDTRELRPAQHRLKVSFIKEHELQLLQTTKLRTTQDAALFGPTQDYT